MDSSRKSLIIKLILLFGVIFLLTGFLEVNGQLRTVYRNWNETHVVATKVGECGKPPESENKPPHEEGKPHAGKPVKNGEAGKDCCHVGDGQYESCEDHKYECKQNRGCTCRIDYMCCMGYWCSCCSYCGPFFLGC